MKKIIPILALIVLLLTGCITKKAILLPELSDKTASEIEVLLNDSRIKFEFIEENNFEVSNNLFVRYEQKAVGDEVKKDETIKVVINVHKLPDLTGMNESQIIVLFDKLGIDITTQFDEGNNDYQNLTWSGYVDQNVGDKVTSILSKELIIKIAVNSLTVLPDLSGLNIFQVTRALDASFIQYKFEYITDDSKEADIYDSYAGHQPGDFIEDDEVIVVKLYTNSFLNDDEGLFISKFWDNEGKNNALELYNPTNEEINLDEYSIAVLVNGALTPGYEIPLNGHLASKNTFIIANPQATRDLVKKAQMTSTLFEFDSRDVIQLRYKNGSYVDIISTIGSSVASLTNEVYVREFDTKVGSRVFSFLDWDEYIPTFLEPFGTHPYAKPISFNIDLSLLARDFGHAQGGMVAVDLVKTTDGDTAEFRPGFESNARIRFLGVDTRETHPIVEPMGMEAKIFTQGLLESATQIHLQSDPNSASVDNYGRHLGFIWADGKLVNYLLVLEGYSENFLTSKTKIAFENRYIYRWFEDAEQHAKDLNLGVHAL